MADEKIVQLAELLNQAEVELLDFEEELDTKGRLDIVRLQNSRLKVANFYNTAFKGMIEKPFAEEIEDYYSGVHDLIAKAYKLHEKNAVSA